MKSRHASFHNRGHHPSHSAFTLTHLRNAKDRAIAVRSAACDVVELDRLPARPGRKRAYHLGLNLVPLSTESLSLEVQPLLLVPDLLDKRDMADLVAALKSMR